MLAKVCGAALQGIDAIKISIEALVEPGFSITLVGMPDKAVKESIQRVESAISHSGLDFPRRKILVNMAPAEVRKEGAAYDLPLAVGILAADRKLPAAIGASGVKKNNQRPVSPERLRGDHRPVIHGYGKYGDCISGLKGGRLVIIGHTRYSRKHTDDSGRQQSLYSISHSGHIYLLQI